MKTTRHYSDPRRGVFYAEEGEAWRAAPWEKSPAGWYYWDVFEGSSGGRAPVGPFKTEEEAVEAEAWNAAGV